MIVILFKTEGYTVTKDVQMVHTSYSSHYDNVKSGKSIEKE